MLRSMSRRPAPIRCAQLAALVVVSLLRSPPNFANGSPLWGVWQYLGQIQANPQARAKE